jgi:hypothetical protein
MDVIRNIDRDGEVGEGTSAYTVTGPVVLHVLSDKFPSLASEGTAHASQESPGTVWVSGPHDESALIRAISEHPSHYKPTTAINDAEAIARTITKAKAGEVLTDAELRLAVSYLLNRIP